MVVVEIRAPRYDEESGSVVWKPLAFVKADGGDIEIHGETVLLDDLMVIDIATNKRLGKDDAPEVWARNLPYAFRAGDLVAAVIVDTDPPAVSADPDGPRQDLPIIPAPPKPSELSSRASRMNVGA